MALTALQVKNAKPGDKLGDGGGLRLDVDRSGNKSWVFRYTSPTTGRERFMGLGPLRDVSLAQARDAAADARALTREHKDPIEERRQERTAAKVEASRAITFKAYAEAFIAGREAGWKNPRHRQAWRNSMRDYAYPHIGHLPIADVDTAAVLKVLRPIWGTKTETASRVRGRIEAILSAAKVEGLRAGDNPALWRGHIAEVLPGKRSVQAVEHHAALPYGEMPAFWKSLAKDTSDAARMLRWIILTACRYGEAVGTQPGEVKSDLWRIPARRMKGGKEHTVPLTPLALEQLPFRPVSDVALSTAIKRHTDSPATTHGMRSTFRDYCGDCTDFPRELAEMALAHVVGSEVEAAYRRGDALEKRRKLMAAWAKYCSQGH
ncbi:tyrosine-type recombinase/integrase [Bradyrhizobium sp.]|uniref:tyrosine-type recombinase/integrase n=1 Tax=Bradyrhizobium sp. TaxID=376 RepID=UPI003C31CEE5